MLGIGARTREHGEEFVTSCFADAFSQKHIKENFPEYLYDDEITWNMNVLFNIACICEIW